MMREGILTVSALEFNGYRIGAIFERLDGKRKAEVYSTMFDGAYPELTQRKLLEVLNSLTLNNIQYEIEGEL